MECLREPDFSSMTIDCHTWPLLVLAHAEALSCFRHPGSILRSLTDVRPRPLWAWGLKSPSAACLPRAYELPTRLTSERVNSAVLAVPPRSRVRTLSTFNVASIAERSRAARSVLLT